MYEADLEVIKESRARVLHAANAERRRIERSLHDGVQQHLVALAVRVRLAKDLIFEDPDEACRLLDQLGDDIRGSLNELRTLAHHIYPALLVDGGLVDALPVAPVALTSARASRPKICSAMRRTSRRPCTSHARRPSAISPGRENGRRICAFAFGTTARPCTSKSRVMVTRPRVGRERRSRPHGRPRGISRRDDCRRARRLRRRALFPGWRPRSSLLNATRHHRPRPRGGATPEV